MNKGRSTWQVGTESFPWRVYEEWRRNKGWMKTQRAQVDLCHFTRVLLIFGPWRWFWQSPAGPLLDGEPPFVDAVLLALLGFVAYAFYAWTHVMLTILAFAGGALAAAALIAGLVWLAFRKKRWFQRTGEKLLDGIIFMVDRVISPVLEHTLLPVVGLIGKAAGWFGDRIFVPAGAWFFQRPLFVATIGGELIGFPAAGISAIVLVAGGLTVGFWLIPFWFGLVGGSLVALVALIVAGVVFLPKIGRAITRWLDRRWPVKPRDESQETKPKKEHPTRDVVWSFLVAKKHRICPIIQPTGTGTE